MTTPDAIEPIVAYRSWQVDGKFLKPTAFGQAWDPGVNEAACFDPKIQRVLRNSPEGVVPDEVIVHSTIPDNNCGCGFWGLKSARAAHLRMKDNGGGNAWQTGFVFYGHGGGQQYTRPAETKTPIYVTGSVELWGKIIIGEHGYRAQFARITSLIVPPGTKVAQELQAAADHYGVPIKGHDDLGPVEQRPWHQELGSGSHHSYTTSGFDISGDPIITFTPLEKSLKTTLRSFLFQRNQRLLLALLIASSVSATLSVIRLVSS